MGNIYLYGCRELVKALVPTWQTSAGFHAESQRLLLLLMLKLRLHGPALATRKLPRTSSAGCRLPLSHIRRMLRSHYSPLNATGEFMYPC